MHKLSHGFTFGGGALVLGAAMALSLLFGGAPAQAQSREVTSATVVPIRDASGSTDSLAGAKATDALALALEDSKNYRIIGREDLDRALRNLDLTPPLNELEQARLGAELQVEQVFTGTLTRLAVGKNGSVTASLDMRSYNVAIGAVLNGAAVTVDTKPIPQWNGDQIPVINEALREVAERAVIEMERMRLRHGSIMLVDENGVITTDLGINDGITVGTRLLVMRGFYQPERDKTLMRAIGTLEVLSSQVRLSTATSVGGQVPRIGDRVYPLYSPPSEVQSSKQKRQTTQGLRNIAGLGIILGIVATALGPQSNSAPGANVVLFQQSPGATPVIRVNLQRGMNPDPEHTHVWLIYRGGSPGFIADATSGSNPLVAAIAQGSLNFYEDTPDRQVGISFANSFFFFDAKGAQQTATTTITYNHLELVPGNSYFYKARRVVDPLRPILPQQVGPQQVPVAVTFTVTPTDALSEASQAAGPVTYALPPTQVDPTPTTPVDPKNATFTWVPSIGLDQYQVQVYDDPLLTHLVTASPILTSTGETQMRFTFSDFVFAGNTTFYWVVGGRTIGQASPQCIVGSRKFPFILSTKSTFTTVNLPPNPASASGATNGRPAGLHGFWNEHPRFPR
ncbi:MAG TPA: CsgG/HfaB family protein [Armatimonadota bacterium]|jgi:hypothetical protein